MPNAHAILDNPDICVLPWTRLYVQTTAAMTCCQCSRLGRVTYQRGGGPWTGDLTLWNSPEFVERRKTMLQRGKRGCGVECSMLADRETPREKLARSYVARTRKPEPLQTLLHEIEAGKTTLDTLPLVLTISFGNTCNARCIYCIQRTGPQTRVSTSIDDFTRVLAFARQAFALHLIGGEIFALPTEYLDRILDAVAPSNIAEVQTTTNGIGMTLEAYDRYCTDGGLNHITLSLQTTQRELYHHLNGVDACDTVLANVRAIAGAHAHHHIKILQAIVMAPTYERFTELIDFCAECRIPTLHLMPLQSGAINANNLSTYQIFAPYGSAAEHLPRWREKLAEYRALADARGVRLDGHERIELLLAAIHNRV